jgi:uncharacterized protein
MGGGVVGAPVVSGCASISALSEDCWNRLVSGAGLYLSRGWLAAMESDPAFAARYLAVGDCDSGLLGALPVYIECGQADSIASGALPARAFSDELGCPAVWAPAVLLGSRMGHANRLLIRPDLPTEIRRQTLAALMDAARRVIGDVAAPSVACLHLPKADACSVQAELPGSQILLGAVTASIAVSPGDDLEGYIKQLPRQRRSAIRKERRAFLAEGLEIERGRLSEHVAHAAPLLTAVRRRYGHTDSENQLRRYLERMANNGSLDGSSVMFVCRRGAAVVAFALFFEHDGVLYSRSWGIRDDARQLPHLYANLVYYAAIEHALDNAITRIELGPGSLEAKVLRGATLTPTWSVLALTRPHDATIDTRLAETNSAYRAQLRERLGRFTGIDSDGPEWDAL